MPSVFNPQLLERLPKAFPMSAAATPSNLDYWRNEVSAPSVLATLLHPAAQIPGDLRITTVIEQARFYVQSHPASVPGDQFRDNLRRVQEARAGSYFLDEARTRRAYRHADGHGNTARIFISSQILSSRPRETRVMVEWTGAAPSQRVAVGFRLPAATPPQRWRPPDWEAAISAPARARRQMFEEPQRAPSGRNVLPPSSYSGSQLEDRLSKAQRKAIDAPMLNILAKGGRVWSAEVEIDHLRPGVAAGVLGVQEGQYSTRPDKPSVVACSDSTVDAEIKISCMRDGARPHAMLARTTYEKLYENKARCRMNTGHHVHIDGTRLADLGYETTYNVLIAASAIGRSTQNALQALCASGYTAHRGYGAAGQFYEDERVGGKGPALHGQRVLGASRNVEALAYSGATSEFRLPNGTLEPVRAHAYVALGMGLIDLGERAILDAEPSAVNALAMARDRVNHSEPWDQAQAVSFLLEHLALSDDSFRALAIAGWTAPLLSGRAKRALRARTTLPESVFHGPEVVLAEAQGEAIAAALAHHREQATLRSQLAADRAYNERMAARRARDLAAFTATSSASNINLTWDGREVVSNDDF